MQEPPKRKSDVKDTGASNAKVPRSPELQSGETKPTEPIGFECAKYVASVRNAAADLDHTADIQIHGWAPRLENAMEQVAVGMFNYISELEPFSIDESCTKEIEVTGGRGFKASFTYHAFQATIWRAYSMNI